MGTEIETVRRAQAGDAAAFGQLIAEHQTYVYSIALGVMKDPADAADMTQEAFVRLLRSIGTYRGDTKFTTWLYRLVTNICLDELRRRKGLIESLDAGWDGDDDAPGRAVADGDRWVQPEQRSELVESAGEVRAALGQLPPMQRLALTLFYFGELQDREIGQVMGLPVNTVKSHIHRGKARLAQLLGARLRPEPATASAASRAFGRRERELVPLAGRAAGLGTRVPDARPLLAAARAA